MTSRLALALLLAQSILVPVALAQSSFPTPVPTGNANFQTRFTEILALSRAKNLARQAAELANGGLNVYQADRSMHGSAAQSPHRDLGDHWIFLVKGGSPGFTTPTLETEVRVDKGTFRTSILYNGPVRQSVR